LVEPGCNSLMEDTRALGRKYSSSSLSVRRHAFQRLHHTLTEDSHPVPSFSFHLGHLAPVSPWLYPTSPANLDCTHPHSLPRIHRCRLRLLLQGRRPRRSRRHRLLPLCRVYAPDGFGDPPRQVCQMDRFGVLHPQLVCYPQERLVSRFTIFSIVLVLALNVVVEGLGTGG
jgi:hypothetical protein